MKPGKKHLKIAYLTACDPMNIRSWSGIHCFMGKALEKHCGEVHYIGPIKTLREYAAKIFNNASQTLLGKTFYHWQSIFVAKKYAEIAKRRIEKLSPDVIFAPAASAEMAFLDTGIPVVLVSDGTFAAMLNYYAEFSNFFQTAICQSRVIEDLAIQKSSLLLFPSRWAAQSAIQDCHAEKKKVHIIPFGANLEEIPEKKYILAKKKTDRCRLLFLGVGWERKGGNIAFETLLELEKLGMKAELIICGCMPPKGLSHKNITVIPFLDKNKPADRQQMTSIMLTSDFLFVPSRYEAYGIVFCEANAFGLPAITTATGGVPVNDGENGYALPLEARSPDYAKLINDIYQDNQRYYELVKSSRSAFDEKLNWNAWGKSIKKYIDGIF